MNKSINLIINVLACNFGDCPKNTLSDAAKFSASGGCVVSKMVCSSSDSGRTVSATIFSRPPSGLPTTKFLGKKCGIVLCYYKSVGEEEVFVC